ncbi:MFS transporter [Texcoconibacillus texcoconensis]|uniref:MFS family permease n=1 Tax=Texcoconibacillus texcoconensis TaxID=1095777 RepID=A0A840QQL7_9BACI|nr:MFS transporter [Texcoconibacillus texcoconensis]MBB5173639.1 MFS family permease [Texcoconibacillus texcoconensis]
MEKKKVFHISTEKRNLLIMWIANFLVAASATMILPFLSLYIETFGDYSDAYVQRWAGFIFGITFLVAFFVSPLWGRFGDRFGRKRILLITGYGIALSIFFMGYVSSVEELFFLRLLMGIVTGFIPTSLALISSQTRKEIAGRVLGTLQMGTVSGGLLGPLLGGALADAVGFIYTFILTAITITIATTLVAVGIKEVKVRTDQGDPSEGKYSMKDVFRELITNRVLLVIMFISMIIQTANFSVQPLLALYVDELLTVENVAFLAGLAFSITGLGNLLSTRSWGKLGDRIGHEKVLIICSILAVVFFLPQAFVTNIWQLILLRFLYGLQIGGMIPCITAYIRREAPLEIQGEVLGYNQSFRFLGNVIGPVIGGVASGIWTISSVFFVASGLFASGALLLWIAVKYEQKEKNRNVERPSVRGA